MMWDIPEGWIWKPVAESLTPVRDIAKPAEIHRDCIYVGLEHIQSATGEYEGVRAGTAGIKSNKFVFEPGDLLYGKLRPNLRKCVVAESAGVCSTDLVPLRPVDPATAHFLAMQLRSEPFTANVMRMIGGANLPRINIKDLFTLFLPAPPMCEQPRIYSISRSLSSLRLTQQQLAAAIAEVEYAATAVILGLTPSAPKVTAASTPVP